MSEDLTEEFDSLHPVNFIQGRTYDIKGKEIIGEDKSEAYSAEFIYRPPFYNGCIAMDAKMKVDKKLHENNWEVK